MNATRSSSEIGSNPLALDVCREDRDRGEIGLRSPAGAGRCAARPARLQRTRHGRPGRAALVGSDLPAARSSATVGHGGAKSGSPGRC